MRFVVGLFIAALLLVIGTVALAVGLLAFVTGGR